MEIQIINSFTKYLFKIGFLNPKSISNFLNIISLHIASFKNVKSFSQHLNKLIISSLTDFITKLTISEKNEMFETILTNYYMERTSQKIKSSRKILALYKNKDTVNSKFYLLKSFLKWKKSSKSFKPKKCFNMKNISKLNVYSYLRKIEPLTNKGDKNFNQNLIRMTKENSSNRNFSIENTSKTPTRIIDKEHTISQISNTSRNIYRHTNNSNISNDTSILNKNHFEKSWEKKERENFEKCTFNPLINNNSNVTINNMHKSNLSVFDRLYLIKEKYNTRKQQKIMEYESVTSQKNTFQPQLCNNNYHKINNLIGASSKRSNSVGNNGSVKKRGVIYEYKNKEKKKGIKKRSNTSDCQCEGTVEKSNNNDIVDKNDEGKDKMVKSNSFINKSQFDIKKIEKLYREYRMKNKTPTNNINIKSNYNCSNYNNIFNNYINNLPSNMNSFGIGKRNNNNVVMLSFCENGIPSKNDCEKVKSNDVNSIVGQPVKEKYNFSNLDYSFDNNYNNKFNEENNGNINKDDSDDVNNINDINMNTMRKYESQRDLRSNDNQMRLNSNISDFMYTFQ